MPCEILNLVEETLLLYHAVITLPEEPHSKNVCWSQKCNRSTFQWALMAISHIYRRVAGCMMTLEVNEEAPESGK